MLKLEHRVAAEGEDCGAQNAREIGETFVARLITQPAEGEQECQPDVSEYQSFQRSIGEVVVGGAERVENPGRWIKEGGLDVGCEGLAAINGWIPRGERMVLESLKCVI